MTVPDTTSKDDELLEKITQMFKSMYEIGQEDPRPYSIERTEEREYPKKVLHLIKQYGIQERIDELEASYGLTIEDYNKRRAELTALKDKEINNA